ncbi:MAG TPA: alpha/beta hydrolase [Magnetospirillaceae bacterium]|nr:alpha/beta hydrolase [Magnetospirillaceae bacterium]
MKLARLILLTALAAPVLLAMPIFAAPVSQEPVGIALENWPYPYPVSYLDLTVRGQPLRQAYMDVAPTGKPNGRTALLFHGRNFPASYWKDVIAGLAADGYRVVATDQIGFGKSSKPDIPANLDQFARNNLALLDSLKLDKIDLVAHSMGGMVAVRFVRTYPERVRRLVLEAPIGLEDYRFTVPPVTDKFLYDREVNQTAEEYRKFLKVGYSLDLPDSAVDDFVSLQERLKLSGEYPRWVTNFISSYQMIHDQPVVHEYPLVATPTLFIMGVNDHNAPGRPYTTPELGKKMGFNTDNAKAIAKTMPDAKVVAFDGVGHIPHMERPEPFMKEVKAFLDAP